LGGTTQALGQLLALLASDPQESRQISGQNAFVVAVKYNGEFGNHDVVVRELRASDSAVAKVQIAQPWPDTLNIGDTLYFSFVLFDPRGNFLSRPFTLTLSDPTVLKLVGESGPDPFNYQRNFRFQAVKTGPTLITVRSEAQEASQQILVR
jgi:hypothetical protein